MQDKKKWKKVFCVVCLTGLNVFALRRRFSFDFANAKTTCRFRWTSIHVLLSSSQTPWRHILPTKSSAIIPTPQNRSLISKIMVWTLSDFILQTLSVMYLKLQVYSFTNTWGYAEKYGLLKYNNPYYALKDYSAVIYSKELSQFHVPGFWKHLGSIKIQGRYELKVLLFNNWQMLTKKTWKQGTFFYSNGNLPQWIELFWWLCLYQVVWNFNKMWKMSNHLKWLRPKAMTRKQHWFAC